MAYLSVADTAKIVRQVLKSEYPQTKFYVTSNSYSGGASIDIKWVDGPTTKQVDRVVEMLRGADFDGMVDLKTYRRHWMMPDGTITLAKVSGSGGRIAHQEYPKPHPDAVEVSIGADSIFTTRHESKELVEAVVDAIVERSGWDRPLIGTHSAYLSKTKRQETAYIMDDYSRLPETDIMRRIVWATSFVTGVDCQEALDRQFPRA